MIFLRSLILIVVGLGFLAVAQPAQALGITPAIVRLEGIKSGGAVERILQLSRSRADSDLTVTVAVSGSGARFIKAPRQIKLPAGQKTASVPIAIEPPLGVTGAYRAVVSFGWNPEQDLEVLSEVSTLPSIKAEFIFTVVPFEKRALAVSNVSMPGALTGEPLVVFFEISNNGNGPAAVDRLDIRLVPGDPLLPVYQETVALQSEAALSPFTNKVVTKQLPMTAPRGDYMVEFTFLADGQTIHTAEIPQRFLVAPLLRSSSPAGKFGWWLIAGGVLAISGGGWLMVSVIRRWRKKHRTV